MDAPRAHQVRNILDNLSPSPLLITFEHHYPLQRILTLFLCYVLVTYLLTVGSFDFQIDVDGSANAYPGDEVQLLSLDAEYPVPECLAELPSFPETIFGSASGLMYPGTQYLPNLLPHIT